MKRLSIWRQHEAVSLQLNAIRRGVTAVVPDNVLKRCGDIMTPGELSSIIFGQREIDIKDWKENTKVEGHSMLQVDKAVALRRSVRFLLSCRVCFVRQALSVRKQPVGFDFASRELDKKLWDGSGKSWKTFNR